MSAFIGYWGNEILSDLPKKFARVLARLSFVPQILTHDFPDSHNKISIAFWGKHVRPQLGNEKFSVSLSASALKVDSDISVEVRENGLKLSRDKFGRAALFWMQYQGAIWFSSQLQLLLPLLDDPEISLPALYGYSCFSYVPTPLTSLKSIFAVPAGMTGYFQLGELRHNTQHSLEVNWGKNNSEWQEAPDKFSKEYKAVFQLQKLLTEATAEQLTDISSDPVGVFLSGGLDSSIVASLLKRAGAKVRAYTLDFGEHGKSEINHAERVAEYLKIPLVKVPASPVHIRSALSATAAALDTPFGDGVTVPLYLLNQVAANECATVFNGEGGDQLFAGWTNKPIIAADVYQPVHPEDNNFFSEYLRTFHRLQGYEDQVYEKNICEQIKKINPLNWLDEALDMTCTGSLMHRLRRANLMLKGAQNIQPRATNLSLAHGLAIRTPFCNSKLTAWTFQIPGDWFLRGSQEKYLLKKAVELWLPEEIVWREKRGMGVPLTSWCLGPLWDEVGKWLQPAILRHEGIWQADLALRISTGKLSGQIQGRRIGEILWLMMMWQVWRVAVLGEEKKRSFYSPFLLPARFWQAAYPSLQGWLTQAR